METHTVKLDTEVLSTKTLIKATTKKVVVKKYYDLDGQIIDEGTDTYKFDHDVPFEITEKKIKYNWEFIEPTIHEVWGMTLNGKKVNYGELTQYRYSKTQLTLHACVGAG